MSKVNLQLRVVHLQHIIAMAHRALGDNAVELAYRMSHVVRFYLAKIMQEPIMRPSYEDFECNANNVDGFRRQAFSTWLDLIELEQRIQLRKRDYVVPLIVDHFFFGSEVAVLVNAERLSVSVKHVYKIANTSNEWIRSDVELRTALYYVIDLTAATLHRQALTAIEAIDSDTAKLQAQPYSQSRNEALDVSRRLREILQRCSETMDAAQKTAANTWNRFKDDTDMEALEEVFGDDNVGKFLDAEVVPYPLHP